MMVMQNQTQMVCQSIMHIHAKLELFKYMVATATVRAVSFGRDAPKGSLLNPSPRLNTKHNVLALIRSRVISTHGYANNIIKQYMVWMTHYMKTLFYVEMKNMSAAWAA
jgi:hypothetical protein